MNRQKYFIGDGRPGGLSKGTNPSPPHRFALNRPKRTKGRKKQQKSKNPGNLAIPRSVWLSSRNLPSRYAIYEVAPTQEGISRRMTEMANQNQQGGGQDGQQQQGGSQGGQQGGGSQQGQQDQQGGAGGQQGGGQQGERERERQRERQREDERE